MPLEALRKAARGVLNRGALSPMRKREKVH